MSRSEQPFAASVIVPAHNEQTVIGRLLGALPSHVDGRPLQVIVACNGCADDTAGVARRHGAEVVEVAMPSKIAALNAGDANAKAFPRLYMDADIGVTGRTVVDLVRVLGQPGALCAAPPSRMELEGRPWPVRAYLSFWRELMRIREGYVGAGVYALSREGRSRFAQFPNLIADDTFVRNLFSRNERVVVATDPTIVEAPRTMRALFRRRVRVCIGNMQLSERVDTQSLPGSRERRISWWSVALSRPSLIPHSLVYSAVNAMARLAAEMQSRCRKVVAWGRDNTTRSAAPR